MKFIGDAVMAVFGAPSAHEDDPERAVRAALAIREALAASNERRPELDLHVRMGVNTGEALVSPDANIAAGETFVSGDIVNTASRLQTAAPIDGVVVGEARRTARPATSSSTSRCPQSRPRASRRRSGAGACRGPAPGSGRAGAARMPPRSEIGYMNGRRCVRRSSACTRIARLSP